MINEFKKTNLFGKNGQELKEGDIFDLAIGGIAVLKYDTKKQEFVMQSLQSPVLEDASLDIFVIEYLEVIGNIKKDPDILELFSPKISKAGY